MWPTDRYYSCPKFKDMNSKQRAEILERVVGCSRCTSWKHNKSACPVKIISCSEVVSGIKCGRDHSRMVCNSGVAYCLSLHKQSDHDDYPTISYLQDVQTSTGDIRVFWDTGANRALIDDKFAQEQSLRAVPVNVTVNIATREKKDIDTKMYEVMLVDRDGQR